MLGLPWAPPLGACRLVVVPLVESEFTGLCRSAWQYEPMDGGGIRDVGAPPGPEPGSAPGSGPSGDTVGYLLNDKTR